MILMSTKLIIAYGTDQSHTLIYVVQVIFLFNLIMSSLNFSIVLSLNKLFQEIVVKILI
jgi:hypothetical protein